MKITYKLIVVLLWLSSLVIVTRGIYGVAYRAEVDYMASVDEDNQPFNDAILRRLDDRKKDVTDRQHDSPAEGE